MNSDRCRDALAWHVNCARWSRQVLAAERTETIQLLGAAVRASRRVELLAFSVADTHVHFLLRGEREAVGRAIQGFEGGVSRTRAFVEGFSPAHFEAIRSQAHLSRAFWYAARQDLHHGTRRDPFVDGNLLADQLGLRLLDRRAWERVRTHLPRVRLQELLGLVEELGAGVQHRTPLQAVAEGAASALGRPTLDGRTPQVAGARSAALRVGSELGLEEARIAEQMAIAPATLRVMRRRVPEEALLRAVRGQVLLRLGMMEELRAVLTRGR